MGDKVWDVVSQNFIYLQTYIVAEEVANEEIKTSKYCPKILKKSHVTLGLTPSLPHVSFEDTVSNPPPPYVTHYLNGPLWLVVFTFKSLRSIRWTWKFLGNWFNTEKMKLEKMERKNMHLIRWVETNNVSIIYKIQKPVKLQTQIYLISLTVKW